MFKQLLERKRNQTSLSQGIITESEKRQKKKLLIDYLYANLKNHNFWAYRYFFCEFLGILNVVGALFFAFDTIFFILYVVGALFSFSL